MRVYHLYIIGLLISSFGLTQVLTAQKKAPPVFEKRHKNVYVEALGSSFLLGAHFDMRLKKGQMDGAGLRVGIGGVSFRMRTDSLRTTLGAVVFPLEFNYLTGKRRSSFIAGVGLLPMYATLGAVGTVNGESGALIRDGFALAGGFVNMGYRFQPLRNGLMLQLTLTPVILRGAGLIPLNFGLGLGFGFK
jgi:hypothetical protein